MANLFDDKNIRVGTIAGGLLGAVAPMATMGDKLTVVDVVIGAVALGAIGLGIGYLVTSVKRPQLLANESNNHNETSAMEAQYAGKLSNRTILIVLLGLAATFIVAYSLVPRSELSERTVLASLVAPNEVSEFETAGECSIGNRTIVFQYDASEFCKSLNGEWSFRKIVPSITFRAAVAEGVSRSEAWEVVGNDFGKAVPFLVILAGVVGAYIYSSSRPKNRATN